MNQKVPVTSESHEPHMGESSVIHPDGLDRCREDGQTRAVTPAAEMQLTPTGLAPSKDRA